MKRMALVFIALVLVTAQSAHSREFWIGEYTQHISRAASVPCTGYGMSPIQNGEIFLDQWAYTRASVAHLCIEVYGQGITEYFRSDISRYLKVEASFISSEGVVSKREAAFVAHKGNNAVYAVPLRNMVVMVDQSINGRLDETLYQFTLTDALQVTTSYLPELNIAIHHQY